MPNKSYNRILDEHLHILIAQGNHEAYNHLRKRYHRHALVLTSDLFQKYDDTGITKKELMAVCEGHFSTVISKYISGLSSFYSFWIESTTQVLMDYIIENSYEGEAFTFRGVVSFDQNSDEKHLFSDFLGETGDEKKFKKVIFEIRQVLKKYATFFKSQERALLNLVLEGYSLAELEHSGTMSKSHLYLTYKSAVERLKSYMELA